MIDMKKFAFIFSALLCLAGCQEKVEPDPVRDPDELTFDFTLPIPDSIPYQYAGTTPDAKLYKPSDGHLHSVTLMAAAGLFLAEQAKTAALTYFRNQATIKVTGFIKSLFGMAPDESQTVNIKLDNIIRSLDEINNKLDVMYNSMIEIQKQIDESAIITLSAQVQELNAKTNLMYYHNLETYGLIMNALEAEDAEERIAGIINEWGHTLINGTEARLNALAYVQNIIDPLSYFTYHESKLNLIQIYDLTVFDAYPWEIMGYNDREEFRTKVSLEASLSLSFAFLYYTMNGLSAMSETCLNAMEKFYDFMHLNEVFYDHDNTRCQIRGAYLLFDRNAVFDKTDTWETTDMWIANVMHQYNKGYEISWYENEWLFSEFNMTTPSNSSEAITAARNTQLSTSEIEAIMNYYKKVSPNSSLFSILKNAQLQFPDSYKNDTEIYIGSNKTNTCLWITNNSDYHSYYSEFSDIYDAGHPISEMKSKVGYVFYQGTYSFRYPNDYYSARVNVPDFSGSYRHYRRWMFSTQASSYKGPGAHFFLFKKGSVSRYADFNSTL